MLKKVINYVDYDGNARDEIAYFNLDIRELYELNADYTGGLEAYYRTIVESSDVKEIISVFKRIIDMAYGRKSPDGRKFEKSPEILNDFKSTQAYTELYMSLVEDVDKATDFMNGVVATAKKQIEDKLAKNENATVVDMPTH